MPALLTKRNARWAALDAIDAFFSWTEHVFIHIAILQGRITTRAEVAELAESDWQIKFKTILDLNDREIKKYFDELVLVRRQLRNFMAQGAFGKQGEAFSFHSRAGAVPVLMPHKSGKHRFSLGGDLEFKEQDAIVVIESIVSHLWSGEREPARLYIQESRLPIIFTLAADGTYTKAMQSVEDMEALLDRLHWEADRAANMDW